MCFLTICNNKNSSSSGNNSYMHSQVYPLAKKACSVQQHIPFKTNSFCCKSWWQSQNDASYSSNDKWKRMFLKRANDIFLNEEQADRVQADLVICGLFICKFPYEQLRMILIYRTYPIIYSHPWSFYMQICYMRVIFYGPYLLNITRSTCIVKLIVSLRKSEGLFVVISEIFVSASYTLNQHR